MKNLEIYQDNSDNAWKIARDKHWPVVYILNDDNKKMYIGETTNVEKRFLQHLKDPVRKSLYHRMVIKHEESNKSLAYLIESDLINRAFADKTYQIVNKKMQSGTLLNGHDFYNKTEYSKELKDIWNELKDILGFQKTYEEIENDELFKYSPWKEFSEEQISVINNVVNNIMLNKNSFISGGAGTGKTLLVIRIAMDYLLENNVLEGQKKRIAIYSAKKGNTKTFTRVLNELDPFFKKGIKVIKDIKYDDIKDIDYILIDEAQRLRKKSKFSAPHYFIEDKADDELEWLSINNVSYGLFYDHNQKFNKNDMDLIPYIEKENELKLNSQYRMKSGDKFIKFIQEFLGIIPESNEKFDFGDYDMSLFLDKAELFKKVLNMNSSDGWTDGKSRMLASLSVEENNEKWKTLNTFRKKDSAKITDYSNIETDFTFGEYKAVWNKKFNYEDWLENSDVFEVGCVHTVQGRDLSYAGVMFANNIREVDGEIEAKEESKHEYFILMTRGIYGQGLYFENNSMKLRFERYLNRIKK